MGVKLPRQKINYGFFLFFSSLCLKTILPPLLEVQCPNFLDFWNPWGKEMERSVFFGLTIEGLFGREVLCLRNARFFLILFVLSQYLICT